MKELIANLSKQIKEAIQIGEKAHFQPASKEIHTILVCGLGGSGIGGKIIALLLKNDLKVPFLCINDYEVPAWVNENTLVIASSYSGNTEETLSAVAECNQRGSEIAVITSGGEILDSAKTNNWNYCQVPGGEQPRAMLAYSLVQQLYLLSKYGLIEYNLKSDLDKVIDLLDDQEHAIQEEAMRIAQAFQGKRSIIYAGNDFEGVAVRWRQQINENGKELCWHHVLPEMTHNELVGWAGGNKNIAPIFLKSSLNHPRTNRRWEICKEVIQNYTDTILEVEARGTTKLEHTFFLIHLGDWVSYFISEIKNIDPVEVDVISHLKGEMAKMK
ncbi:bifunctional phosphoglucose/phosphomannose isomerase [Crocinitomix algicola]|uniref:bifunctional phosphoglucose/phosphomannose isomerase n=1 Tax=Crocinitomix algicola TaxID=1740263 RepID=UPI0008724A43|nr:bifunctional phosphoglucose/phosphomannose isomerase [Crocinitomix algicola]